MEESTDGQIRIVSRHMTSYTEKNQEKPVFHTPTKCTNTIKHMYYYLPSYLFRRLLRHLQEELLCSLKIIVTFVIFSIQKSSP